MLKRGYENLIIITNNNKKEFSLTSPNSFDRACFGDINELQTVKSDKTASNAATLLHEITRTDIGFYKEPDIINEEIVNQVVSAIGKARYRSINIKDILKYIVFKLINNGILNITYPIINLRILENGRNVGNLETNWKITKTMEQLNSDYTAYKGHQQIPLFNMISLDHWLVDELHIMLRITDHL
ncbi:hypothetical protein C1645_825313 [Glomus cerebriforme]|uniref:Uncharacterized protein n=1 Tax=Glomus cerebriforme TaxID=658196 RepID=A0A397SZ79_9GLOM|nr:hypothetical protein C1645_825313 [Glomus cerebriforme]